MKRFTTLNAAAKSIAFIVIFIFIPTAYVLASPRGLGDPSGAPIDGGISLLVAAGIGYGVKKVRDARKKTSSQAKDNISEDECAKM